MKTGRKYGRRTKERRSVFVFLTGGEGGCESKGEGK
jgi:hypothetical protein